MRGLRSGTHDEAVEPLAGVLGDDRADHEQPAGEGRGPQVARRGLAQSVFAGSTTPDEYYDLSRLLSSAN